MLGFALGMFMGTRGLHSGMQRKEKERGGAGEMGAVKELETLYKEIEFY